MLNELKDLVQLYQEGGILMIPLIFMCFLLWWAIFQRSNLLYQFSQNPESLKKTPEYSLNQYQPLIFIVTAAAPLVGLLGTVIGMIETFDSLADAALYTQNGGIAAGISQALLTTQMGLVIAIPGLLAGKFLKRWENKLQVYSEVLS